ncbi:unnamed protein product [Adineta ricciae]|uniref:Apple domain-containing protein n=1 Tax=Adineta ricciae TaxID=249248 RepID=A0A814VSG1_ADIRI|nr:unnamed protein product [Adineta ricciae]
MEFQVNSSADLTSSQFSIPSILQCAMICSSEIKCQTFDYDAASFLCRIFAVWATEGLFISSTLSMSRIGYVKQVANLYSLYGQICVMSHDIHRYLLCSNNSHWSCRSGQFYNGTICQNEYNISSSNQSQCAQNQSLYWNGTHCVSTSTILLSWNTTGITVAGKVATPSSAPDRLHEPFGLALDSADTLYIADQNNNRIQKWLSGAPNGSTLAGQANGASGASATTLNAPSSAAIDTNGNLYIADTNNHRVQFWPYNVSSGTTVAGTGTSGSSSNQLDSPYDIAPNPVSNEFYITDSGNHRVMCYRLGISNGTVVAGGNGPGTDVTQLSTPYGLYFESSSNSLIIANYAANNIVRWVLGTKNWTLVAGSISGAGGYSSTLLNFPRDLTLDWMGNLYVADTGSHRIQFFKAGESNATTIAGVTSTSGANAILLQFPYSLALDSQLNLYVSDTYNFRIQKFLRY